VDFDHPTKEGILKVLTELQKFSQNFRDPKVIEEHVMEIMKLVEVIVD